MSKYGFEAIERDFVSSIPNPKTPTPLSNTELPQTKLAEAVLAYAKSELSEQTVNHSLRAFLYSRAIIHDQFPDWELEEEVIFVTALLHDIGTSDKNLKATKLSFEYYGGFLAHDFVLSNTKDREFADAVAEAVIRHQDLKEPGFITKLGLIIQISTVLDNVGFEVVSKLVHPETLSLVNRIYSRKGWLSCFAKVVEQEGSLKPWSHSTSLGIEQFQHDVLHNPLRYE